MKKAGVIDFNELSGLSRTCMYLKVVERMGIEPTTSSLRTTRSPS